MKIRKDYRIEPEIVEWIKKKATTLDRDETWVLEWCIKEQMNKEPDEGGTDECRR